MDIWGNCTNETQTNTVESDNDDHEHDEHILSIEIKANDHIIILPNVENTTYDIIQYNKNIITTENIIFKYNDIQIGIMYHHRIQHIIFNKFQPIDSSSEMNILLKIWIV